MSEVAALGWGVRLDVVRLLRCRILVLLIPPLREVLRKVDCGCFWKVVFQIEAERWREREGAEVRGLGAGVAIGDDKRPQWVRSWDEERVQRFMWSGRQIVARLRTGGLGRVRRKGGEAAGRWVVMEMITL